MQKTTGKIMLKITLTLPLLMMLLLVSGCATQPKWAQYEMGFGLTADAGQTRISDQAWQLFRDEEIIPRFPDGFTVFNANGYWRSDTQTYAEPSMILMIVAPDTADTQKKMNAIAEAYKQRFHQESVLQINSRVKVDFHN